MVLQSKSIQDDMIKKIIPLALLLMAINAPAPKVSLDSLIGVHVQQDGFVLEYESGIMGKYKVFDYDQRTGHFYVELVAHNKETIDI